MIKQRYNIDCVREVGVGCRKKGEKEMKEVKEALLMRAQTHNGDVFTVPYILTLCLQNWILVKHKSVAPFRDIITISNLVKVKDGWMNK